ncbi:MAG: diguanylate cyclase [Thermodesulfobacteriota bacterium]
MTVKGSEPPAPWREFLTRALLTVLKLARDPDRPELDRALGGLQNSLAAGAGFDELEEAVERVKDQVLKSDLGLSGPECPAPGPAVPPPAPNLLSELKNAYLECLNELKVGLDEEYLGRISAVLERLDQAREFGMVFALRTDILEIVRRYTQQVFEERKKTAAFIADVAGRLAEVERHLASSVESITKDYQANVEFDTRLATEINRTAVTVRESEELEQLKKMVMSKLKTIGEAVKKKRDQDKTRLDDAGRKLDHIHRQFGGVQEDLSRIEAENKALLQKLMQDYLTGAQSRLACEERLSEELVRFRRYKRPFCLLMFDLDYFKEINDRHGHLIGDRCLVETVGTVKTMLRDSDLLARYGGDEFIVLLPETDRSGGAEVADKLRRRIAETDFLVKGQKISLTISLGVTEVEKTDRNAEALFNRVDQALYQAKRCGRNQVGVL